jgi:hypothetical protein
LQFLKVVESAARCNGERTLLATGSSGNPVFLLVGTLRFTTNTPLSPSTTFVGFVGFHTEVAQEAAFIIWNKSVRGLS